MKRLALGAALVLSVLGGSISGLAPQAAAQEIGSTDRIHILASTYSDMIIVESNGRFGLIDSGEDADMPDGTDPNYPINGNLYGPDRSNEQALFSYLDSLGVSGANLEFYIGTHAHSDHIGSADELIRIYQPQRIYTPEYSDAWISDPNHLWDNQWNYDHLVEAATWAQEAYGAEFYQHFNPTEGFVNDPSTATASTLFTLGNMTLQLFNFEEDYKQPPYVYDANLMSLGVKVETQGHSAFLAADIEKTDGEEDRLATQLSNIDLLKMGHHGISTSNSVPYLYALAPKIAVQTGVYWSLPLDRREALAQMGTEYIPMDEVISQYGLPAVVATFTASGVTTNVPTDVTTMRRSGFSPYLTAYRGGLPYALKAWVPQSGSWYYFDDSATAAESKWIQDGPWYYLTATGQMATGWTQDYTGKWYYLNGSGAMQASQWITRDGVWHYLTGSGAMADNQWIRDGGVWYFLKPGGAMATGWTQDSTGTWYYMNSSGAMQASRWIGKYYVNASGAWTATR